MFEVDFEVVFIKLLYFFISLTEKKNTGKGIGLDEYQEKISVLVSVHPYSDNIYRDHIVLIHQNNHV